LGISYFKARKIKMPGSPKKMAIGILLYNGSKLEFSRLLHSIYLSHDRYVRANAELDINILLKWNSEPSFDVAGAAAKYNFKFSILEGTFNDGFGAAHNRMMKAGFEHGADCYLCVNPDGFLEPDAITALIHFDNNLEQPALLEALQFPREHPKPYNPFTGITPWCSGACLYISKRAYEIVGGFDENIFMYCEDIDLSWRVRDLGYQCYVCSSAVFYHDVKEAKSQLISQLMLESARYLAYKWCADGFREEMERLLVEQSYYPAKEYIPPISQTKRIPSKPGLQEWRQLLSFAVPRW
jgi:hypothetical protein